MKRKDLLDSLLPAWKQPTLNHIDERSTLSIGRENTSDDMQQQHQS